MQHHPTLPPSSFPALAKCPRYESGEAGEAADEGTDLHLQTATALMGGATPLDALARLAVNRARLMLGDREPMVEKRLALLGPDMEEITFGTADVVCIEGKRALLIDHKFGREWRDHRAQLDLYALMIIDEFGVADVACCVSWPRLNKLDNWHATEESCQYIYDIIDRVNDPKSDPQQCEYCSWCANIVECTAVVRDVVTVATEYADVELHGWHPSEITEPLKIKRMLRAVPVLEKWCKSVKHHFKELPEATLHEAGYELRPGRTDESIPDVQAAFKALGLPSDTFLSCCEAQTGKLKKALAESMGLSSVTKKVRDEFAARLGALLHSKQTAPVLKALKEIDNGATE